MAPIMSCKLVVLLFCTFASLQASALPCVSEQECKTSQEARALDASPVAFTLYYESLCPFCKNFITTMLYPTYQKIPSLFNLTLIPYGNAFEHQSGSQWTFECQHGPQECVGNIIATCTIDIVKNISVYFPFLNCMELSSLAPTSAAQQCANQFAVPLNEILNCSTSSYGNQLQHQMALQTDALSPKHQYVPWVTLNGAHTDQIQTAAQSNLLKLICDTYQGTKPSACTQG